MDTISFERLSDGLFGASLNFKLSMANIGFKAITVTGFDLDFGKDINEKYKDNENVSPKGFLRFRHVFPRGSTTNGRLRDKREQNQPFQLFPGGHEGPIHLSCLIHYDKKDDGEYSTFFNELIASGRYSIIANASGGKTFKFVGTQLSIDFGT